MNAERRKRIEVIRDRLLGLRSELEGIRDEERDAFENLPESLAAGERGSKIEEAASALEEAVDDMETLEGKLEEIAQ